MQIADACCRLQQRAEQSRQPPFLAHAEPQQTCAFDRPHRSCRARVESERDREAREDHAERSECFDEQPERLATRGVQTPAEQQIERAERERTPREPVLDARDHGRMQRECDDWQAEHERARDVALQIRRLAHAVQNRDGDIHQEEQDQERIGREQVVVLVRVRAPQAGDREREHEAQYVQDPPGPEPRDGEHTQIQDCVVAEQRDVVAAARRNQDRREEAAGGADDRERQRVLRNRQYCASDRNDCQQHEGECERQEFEQPRRCENGEIQTGNTAALQELRIYGALLAQPPTEDEQRESAER